MVRSLGYFVVLILIAFGAEEYGWNSWYGVYVAATVSVWLIVQLVRYRRWCTRREEERRQREEQKKFTVLGTVMDIAGLRDYFPD